MVTDLIRPYRIAAARLIGAAAIVVLTLGGCQPGMPATPAPAPDAAGEPAFESTPDADTGAAPDATSSPETMSDLDSEVAEDSDGPKPGEDGQRVGVTNQRLDGNRVVQGYTDLSTIRPIDVELDGVPAWVASVPTDEGVVWGVVLEDGRTQAVLVANGVVTPVPTEPAELPPGMPPLLRYLDGTAEFVIPSGEVSPATNAVPVGDTLIGVDEDGDLIIGASEARSLDADALPDARVLVDDRNRVLFLSGPTARYAHGALGDQLEAASITLAEIEPEPRIAQVLQIPAPQVMEGIAPIWTDLDGDGGREILATLSDSANGARFVAFREDGTVAGEGPAIGQGNRWRHSIAVAPFGPQREPELATVRTPHIGGVVEFYALQDGRLDIVAALPGFTSHMLGSRNLDMAMAAAPADERQAILLAPNQDRTRMGAVRRAGDSAEATWFVDVGGAIVTNVAAASVDGDQIAVAVGRADGVLRIWQPK